MSSETTDQVHEKTSLNSPIASPTSSSSTPYKDKERKPSTRTGSQVSLAGDDLTNSSSPLKYPWRNKNNQQLQLYDSESSSNSKSSLPDILQDPNEVGSATLSTHGYRRPGDNTTKRNKKKRNSNEVSSWGLNFFSVFRGREDSKNTDDDESISNSNYMDKDYEGERDNFNGSNHKNLKILRIPMSHMRKMFYYIGFFCSMYPGAIFVVALFGSFLMGQGIWKTEIVTTPEKIWVPPDSTTSKEQQYFNEKFNPFYRINQIYLQPKQEYTSSLPSTMATANDATTSQYKENMIQKKYIQRLLTIQKQIQNHTIIYDGEVVSLDDLCYKPIQGKGCIIESAGQYWLMNRTYLSNDPEPAFTVSCQSQEPHVQEAMPCTDQIGTPVMPSVVFGGLGIDPFIKTEDPCDNSVPSAEALTLTFLLNNYEDESYTKKAKQWEKEVFLDVAENSKNRYSNDIMAPMIVKYMAQRSVEDSLDVETSQNTWVIIVSYICMLLYVSLTLGQFPDLVRSRFWVALLGITIVVVSLSSSLGILSQFGLKTTLIIWEVAPFLLLAIGVDNMFIISREFDTQWYHYIKRKKGQLENMDRSHVFGMTLAEVGPSILAAAVSEICAFAVGALTDIPALQQFCLLAALAVFIDFLFQITLFIAGLELDTRRVNSKRYDFLPCFIQKGKVTNDNQEQINQFINFGAGEQNKNGEYERILQNERLEDLDVDNIEIDKDIESHNLNINGDNVDNDLSKPLLDSKIPLESSISSPPPIRDTIRTLMEKYYVPCLFSKVGKTLVIITYFALTVFGIYSLNKFELGLEPQLAAPENFYLIDYYNVEFSLGDAGPPAYVVIKDVDYSSDKVRKQINKVGQGVSYLQQYVENPIYSWIDAYENWASNAKANVESGQGACYPTSENGNDVDMSDFITNVKFFLGITIDGTDGCCKKYGYCGEQYVSDVVFKNTTTDEGLVEYSIDASRIRFQMQPLQNESAFINSYYYMQKYLSILSENIDERYPGQKGDPSDPSSALAFPYSLYFVFYEQYTYIMGIAIQNFVVALCAVILSTSLLTNVSTGMLIGLFVVTIICNMLGILYLWNELSSGYGIRINAVSVVNLVMATGLSAEFVVHICTAFLKARGHRDDRARHALITMGSSIFSGITLTKLVGVIILSVAPSHLFRVYYFRMYAALIAMGAFCGLAFVPVFLSFFGPDTDTTTYPVKNTFVRKGLYGRFCRAIRYMIVFAILLTIIFVSLYFIS